MINYLVVLMLLLQGNIFAASVNIPDKNFLTTLLKAGLDKNGNGKIESGECEHVKSLNVSNKEIHGLTGIDAFKDLDSLNCSMNMIASIDLTHNKSLTFFDCSFNVFTDLNLEKNLCLAFLDCQYNVLDNLVLKKNNMLKELICNNNQIENLDLSQNIKLKTLRCSNNGIISLNLKSNTELTNINYVKIQKGSANISNAFEDGTTDCIHEQINSMYFRKPTFGSQKPNHILNTPSQQVQRSNATMQNKSSDVIFYRFQNSGLRR